MNKMRKLVLVLLVLFCSGLLASGFQEKGNNPSGRKIRIPVTKAKLVKRVDPVYPKEALQQKIEGVVILEVSADERGSVDNVEVVKSAHPLLGDAAINAVRQWQYKPFLDDKGNPVGFLFTVTVNFSLKGEKTAAMARVPEPSGCAEIVKKVEPVYPEAAKKDKIKGTVILVLQVDEKGQVKDVRVVSSDHELLSEAAINATRQWQYKPCIGADGKAQSFNCTVTIIFVSPGEVSATSSSQSG